MQITKQADYAIRTIHYLSYLEPNVRAATRQIAAEKSIPPSFLAKIISQLSIAGLIHTSRGARGGVMLARAPKDITVLDVVESIDGPIALNECTFSPSSCPFVDDCPLHDMWMESQSDLVKRLDGTTFQQLIEKEQKAKAAS
jgi:Rrf2 family protein